MPECGPCTSPLWPCAMTGAAACLAGFRDIGVVIHGSSGCFFYTASLVEPPVYGTSLIETEIVFGTGDRLLQVVEDVGKLYPRVAVVTTCVPSVMGEDLTRIFGDAAPLILDSPGYLGGLEAGYHAAIRLLAARVDPDGQGVNIDGLGLVDPFYRGNLLEATRLLTLTGLAPSAIAAGGSSGALSRASPLTLTVNPDLESGIGSACGSLLGCGGVTRTFAGIARDRPDCDLGPLEQEVQRTEERISYACDKYLRRFDPPVTAIFGGSAYALFAADLLKRYLDADIAAICTRNNPPASRFPVETSVDLRRIGEILDQTAPDLVLGSEFEHSLCPTAAFTGIIPPLRGRFRLHARPIAGLEGVLCLVEEVLNACRDHAPVVVSGRYSNG